MTTGNFKRISGLALAVAVAAAMAAPAHAQLAPQPILCGSTSPGGTSPLCTDEQPIATSTSTVGGVSQSGQTCGFARGATGCTANDFVGNANVTSNQISSCQEGEQLHNISLVFTVASSQAARYAPGLFIAEQNQDLTVAGGTCTVATFPIAGNLPNPPFTSQADPMPWYQANPPVGGAKPYAGDICGSYQSGFTSIEEIDGVEMICNKDASGHLTVNYMVAYGNQASDAKVCTGPADVGVGTSAKCHVGVASVTNVQVLDNADPACGGKTVDYNADTNTVTSTFTVENLAPTNGLPPNNADGTTFDDPVPATVTVDSFTCTPDSGVVLAGGNCVQNGNDISGTITTFPTGTKVTVQIVGHVTNPAAGSFSFSNTATVTPPGNLVAGADITGNNLCTGSNTLPVHLQSFDVK